MCDKANFRELEFDVIAESYDGESLFVGECKWTNPEIAAELNAQLTAKAKTLPFAKYKRIVPVLFLKHPPKDHADDFNILYPQDVINAMLGD